MFFLEKSRDILEIEYLTDKIKVLSPYGKTYFSNLKPASDAQTIISRLDLLETTVKASDYYKNHSSTLRALLRDLKEIRTSLERARHGQMLSDVELFELKSMSLSFKRLSGVLRSMNLVDENLSVTDLPGFRSLLDPRGEELLSFQLYDEYSKELENLRSAYRNSKDILLKELKVFTDEQHEKYGISIRPNGEVAVPRSFVPEHECYEYESENVTHITYKVNMEKLSAGTYRQFQSLEHSMELEEDRVRSILSESIGKLYGEIDENLKKISVIDYNMAAAGFAIGYRLSRPIIESEGSLKVEGGFHIQTMDNLARSAENFVPIDISLDRGVCVITGANMGGKTVSLKLIGQIAYMVSMGLFVPATSVRINPFEYVFISSGDDQSVDMGLSSFASEMVSLSKAIKHAHRKGLILVDEISRGTNPEEGYALSKAIMDHLETRASTCVFTTHLSNLTENRVHYQVRGLVDFDYALLDSKDIGVEDLHKFMDYTLEKKDKGADVPKDAINIARFLDLDVSIIDNARKILEGGKNAR